MYRGAEPSETGLEELQRKGVKLVIDLREPGAATVREREEVERLKMHYLNVPFKPFSAPQPAEVHRVLMLLLNRGGNAAFVHCRRGKDRTGTVIACYRVQHDGWKNSRALEEANEFGMSWSERGMRAFILRFAPFTDTGLLPSAPELPPAR